MTDDRLPLAELLQKARDGNFLHGGEVLQSLIEAEKGQVSAGRYERTSERATRRNVSHDRTLDWSYPELLRAEGVCIRRRASA